MNPVLFAEIDKDVISIVVFFGLIALLAFSAVDGWQLVAQALAAVRRFLADQAGAYKAAGVLSLLTVTALILDLRAHDDRQLERRYGDLRYGVYFGIAALTALVLLPFYFAAVLALAFLYRNFVAPAVEVVALVARAAASAVAFLVSPFRGPDRPTTAERNRAAERERVAAREQSDRKRREAVRSRCDIFYTLHAPEIGARFTRAMFDDYVRRFLGDDRTADEVEERGGALEAVLRQHLEKVQPPPKFRRLEDIARWFEDQKRQIDALPDDRMRQTLLAKLKARYAELTTQFLEEMQA